MNTVKEKNSTDPSWMQIDYAHYDAEQLASFSLVLETAITAGDCTADEYYPAISLLTDLLLKHKDNLKAITKVAQNENKAMKAAS